MGWRVSSFCFSTVNILSLSRIFFRIRFGMPMTAPSLLHGQKTIHSQRSGANPGVLGLSMQQDDVALPAFTGSASFQVVRIALRCAPSFHMTCWPYGPTGEGLLFTGMRSGTVGTKIP